MLVEKLFVAADSLLLILGGFFDLLVFLREEFCVSIIAKTLSLLTVSCSLILIECIVPDSCEVTSMLTLSVSISQKTSSIEMLSPTLL